MGRRVLVIGAGIAGVQASLDLAGMGIPVTLVEEKPSIGGRMSQLDKTFPTNDCSTCILSPKLVELSSHANITLRAYSSVEKVERNGAGFEVRIRRRARYVDEQKCTACGLCAEKCPVKIPDLFNRGIVTAKCIGIPYAQAVPAVYRIDGERCLYLSKGKCGACDKVCPAGAIDYRQEDRLETEAFDSIILAAGCEEYTPRIRPEFGYQVFPNVITSIEYERLLSASGPTAGEILRPSDGRQPRRIAFLQCVGSRDPAAADRGYCSSYCCMQATKDAIITREHLPESETAIFYIDLRAFGKDFDRFVDRAKEEYRVRYIKSRISEVSEDPETGDLSLHYLGPEGSVARESFDLVVLSVGIGVPKSVRSLLAGLGVRTDAYGFCRGHGGGVAGGGVALGSAALGNVAAGGAELEPVDTNVEGVYACGTLCGPMDIPETVVSAGAAAAKAARGLLERGSESGGGGGSAKKTAAASCSSVLDLRGAPLRIGVVVCRCGVNIASVVDVPAVAERAAALSNVVFTQELTYACSQDSINLIINRIGELSLSRLVVASCSPRTHEHLFRTALEKAGLNKYLLQMTNIRDQCSWVHRDDPEAATEKAFDLVRMAVARARFLQPLEELESEVNKRCLVIGGGLAGMTAALAVADNGFPVCLVEKEQRLGGNLRQLRFTLETEDLPVLLEGLIRRVEKHPLIDLCLGNTLKTVDGYVGNFRSALSDGEKIVEHGTVIVATGAEEHRSESYGFGTDPYIVTQREFETMLVRGSPVLPPLDSVVMIQCVDSREGDHNYCSRVCCGEAVKNALRFKRDHPRGSVTVLYRDVRTYGLKESRYTEARKAGVLFLRYTEERKPEVEKDERGEFAVTQYDEILKREIRIRAQLLVLSVGIDAPRGNEEIARLLKVPLTEDGFFLEAHVKLRPVDFATDGVFVCGLAHGPKYARESVSQALAAAGRALTVLSRDRISAGAATARVVEERCSGCGLCVEVCPYGAIEVDTDRETAVVNALLCKGCGSCAATCFNASLDVSGFSNRQIIREFEELLVR